MKNKKTTSNNSTTTFIIVAGIIILIVFTSISALNVLPNYESNSYYVKVDEEMDAQIESINIENGKLILTTSGDPTHYCVKSTRSKPSNNNICWQEIKNNKASISVYQYKKYYIWIKDKEGNISSYLSVNAK